MREVLSSHDFHSLLSSNQTVVVDFFADWCGPCRMVAPKFLEMSQQTEWSGAVFAKVNTDQVSDVAKQEGIQALPTFKIYINGSCVHTQRGANLAELESALRLHYVAPVDPSIKDLVMDNEKPEFDAARDVLKKIADNIIREPLNEKFRTLKLTNPIVETKLLVCSGAIQCLYAMGFQDSDDKFLLPPSAPLPQLRSIRDQLGKCSWRVPPQATSAPKPPQSTASTPTFRPPPTPQPAAPSSSGHRQQPTVDLASERGFIQRIESTHHHMLLYEDPRLQEKARKAMDLSERKRLADSESEWDLVKELLRWFKQEFFSWMDKPVCVNCSEVCQSAGTVGPTNADERKWLAGRVELYTCPKCCSKVSFPRYNHPEKLLETRQGRCGEWANTFTLVLRAAGLQCRYVQDWTDHVWCEVFLTPTEPAQSDSKWIHCDPCEQAMNTPLLYEKGWGKKLNYVIAHTAGTREIQDVTWRYTRQFEEIMTRRTLIRESRLTKYLLDTFQSSLSSLPPDQAKNRILARAIELTGMISIGSGGGEEGELRGRTTGSLQWRLERGEIRPEDAEEPTAMPLHEGTTIRPHDWELGTQEIYIRYNCARDEYERGPPGVNPRFVSRRRESIPRFDPEEDGDASGTDSEKLPPPQMELHKGWRSLAHKWSNIERKCEPDWKMVYLARGSDSSKDHTGHINWKINVGDTTSRVQQVKVFASSATFESGVVRWQLCGDNGVCVPVSGFVISQDLDGCSQITLKATLTAGEGRDAWQHAQLCRQKDTDHTVFPLAIVVTLRPASADQSQESSTPHCAIDDGAPRPSQSS